MTTVIQAGTVVGIGRKGDLMAKGLDGKITFLKIDSVSEVCREYAEKKIKYPAVYRVTEVHEKYNRGVLELCQCKGKIRGKTETVRVLMKLLDVLRGSSEAFGEPTIREIYQNRKAIGLGIYYKTEFYGELCDFFIDAVDFVSKLSEIKEILDYNEKIDELNSKISATLKQLDASDIALLPEDWDWQRMQWSESGIAKIQKREKVMDSIVSRVTQMDKSLWLKTWEFKSSSVLILLFWRCKKMYDLFSSSSCKTKAYPFVGTTTVYMRHDEYFGKCLIHDEKFITPNMPKLHYALDFRVRSEQLILSKSLNKELSKFDNAYVFEKRDGFNCLFYLYKNRVIPKTRQNPIASGKILQVIRHPEFPIDSIERIVRDGYVPIFEVWGTVLDQYDIMHGSVDVARVQELEGLPELNVDLIAVVQADYDTFNYQFLPPERILKISKQYGVNHVKYHGKISVSYKHIIELMQRAERINEHESAIITEGFVLHCCNGSGYRMFKVKPLPLMQKDVVTAYTIPVERIKLEISKVLLENDVLEIARNPVEYLKEVIAYLAEDYKMTSKLNKKVNRAFVETIATEFVRKYPEYRREPWKQGVHKMLIGTIKSLL